MASYTNLKDPDETLDFGFDWTDALDDGDSVSSSAWEVTTGLTEESEASSGSTTAVMTSGGTVANVYTLKNTMTTSEGRVYVRRISLYCVER